MRHSAWMRLPRKSLINNILNCVTHIYREHLKNTRNARFTPNRDQLRTDLRVEKFWIASTREQSLNVYRQIAS